MFSKILTGLWLISLPALAANVPNTLEATTPQNITLSAGAVTNVYVTPSTVTSVTVPFWSDTFIASGDPLWICEDIRRCGTTFPASTVSVTGWIFNPQARILKANLQQSTSLIYVYARAQDVVLSGTQNLGAFEWSKQQNPN